MNLVADFFAGAFLCNCLPHLISGLRGDPFPTPFAKPRGVGDSPPLVNFLWGFINAGAGAALLAAWPAAVGGNAAFASALAGAFAMGVYLSLHFGEVRRARRRAG